MAGIPANAVSVDIVGVGAGFHGEYPVHLVPPGASPQLRNVVCSNAQVVTLAGWAKITSTAPNGKRIVHICQVFRSPFVNGDPPIIVERDEVNVWLADAASGAGAFQAIQPTSTWNDNGNARCTSTLDHDGNLVLATSAGVYWWPLSGYTYGGVTVAQAVYDPTGTPHVHYKNAPGTAFNMIFLPGLNDERVLITKAWVTSHFEPHVLLGRLFQDDEWIVNRYAWSDTNNTTRWFAGFDEASGITSVAGFADLPADVSHETPQILAMEQLRDLLIIYTDWNIWTLQFVGAPLMWVRRMVQGECGLAASGTAINCGDKHYFYGRDGHFWEFNGTDKQNIGKPVEDYVNKNIAGDGSIFGFRRMTPDSCVWAFSTSSGSPQVADTAVAFNRIDGSWTIEDFPFTAARSIDASGLGDTIGAIFSYDDLDAAVVDYDALDAAYASYDALDDNSESRDTTSKRLDIEVMGSNDGHFYKRSGWTKDGSDRACTWRTGVLDFGEQLRQKHLSAIEVAIVKDGLVNQGQAIPSSNYAVTVNVYGSDRRESVMTSSILQTQTYRPGTTDDPALCFRVDTRFLLIEITSTSTTSAPKPWALSRLTPYLIGMGTR